MSLLFDTLGPAARAPEVHAAIRALAATGETGRGAVFTRPEVVAAILDLSGYGRSDLFVTPAKAGVHVAVFNGFRLSPE